MKLKVEISKFKTQSSILKVFVFGLISLLESAGFSFGLCSTRPTVQGSSVPVFGYKVIKVYPHDPEAYTQGLVFHQGVLYEGTGLLGKSSLRKVDPETGRILKLVPLPDQLFGEGITLWEDKIIQLTWRSGIGLVYDRERFRLLKKFRYFSEGWGITQDGKQLIMSDGTSFLYFWDPHSFKEVKRIQVRDRGIPITMLNELEYIKGEIFANVYLTDRIARISPETGLVTGWIDLQGLLSAKDRTGKRGRFERHRLRCPERPDLRHRKILAEIVRDPVGSPIRIFMDRRR